MKHLGVRKGAWIQEEDLLLKKCIEKFGEGKWRQVPIRAGLNRCRKSCRLRWFNYLCPNIKRGVFAEDEVDLIIRLHRLLGNRWSLIAGRLPGRTANDVKNYWNSHLRKKLAANIDVKEYPKRDQVIKPLPRTLSKNSIRSPQDPTQQENQEKRLDEQQEHEKLQQESGVLPMPSLMSDEDLLWWNNIFLGEERNEFSCRSESAVEDLQRRLFMNIEDIDGLRNDGDIVLEVGGHWDQMILNEEALGLLNPN